jgi:hypothetical protein
VLAAGFALSTIATAAVAAPPDRLFGGDWPTYRHDSALSAISPLKGGLGKEPRIAWPLGLGGPRVASESVLIRDVTGEGRHEILILGEATVECRDSSGRLLWTITGYPSPAVVDLRDYAGDGSRGILLSTSVGGRVETFMVDGRSGRSTLLRKCNGSA